MSSTYSQIYIQIVIAVKYRRALIDQSWDVDLYKYITGIIQAKGQKLLAINGVEDHVHIFIGMKPSCCLSDLMREVKKASNVYINERGLTKIKFQWQEGFGAFSYSQNAIDNVVKYILRQKEHHRKKTFKKEYVGMLNTYEVDYKEEYLFEWLDETI